nr:fumarylacetoacetate hydrolase family protein [Microbacterium immunditiarum]
MIHARRDVRTVPQLSLRYPDMTVADAYAIQASWLRKMREAGHSLVGRKVGLTSMPMQRAMSIDEPDYGVITDDMVFEDGGDVPASVFSYPRVEVELAYVLRGRLSGPGVTEEDVLRATESIVPAIEILDSRIDMKDAATGHLRTIIDTVSDNAADAGMVLGSGRLAPEDFTARRVSAVLRVNGVIEETGVASAVLGDPTRAVAWLANKLSEYGQSIEAGEIVLSGAFSQSIPVRAGDDVHADFAELGTVSCRFC